MNATLPPKAFPLRSISCTTLPEIPNPATFAKCRTWGRPSAPVNSIRPRSILRSAPSERTSAAAPGSEGQSSVRQKSPPVPRGMNPKVTSGRRGRPSWASPSMTSLAVPSPPTATTRLAPASTTSRASTLPSPRRRVKEQSNSPTASRTARTIASK